MKWHALGILAVALLAGCGTVKYGNPAYAAVEDEMRRQVLKSGIPLDFSERDAVKFDAPMSRQQKLQKDDVMINMEWQVSPEKRVVTRFVGDPHDPAGGKYDKFLVNTGPAIAPR